jgi:ATP-binding cassette, subfamily C (CFTR/MRP), member 10
MQKRSMTLMCLAVSMQVQLAFVAGLVVVLLLIPINRWLAQQIQVASIAMMAAKDTRLSILQVWLLPDLKQSPTCIKACVRALRAVQHFYNTGFVAVQKLLTSIRQVKMVVLESVFAAKITGARATELRWLARRKYLDAGWDHRHAYSCTIFSGDLCQLAAAKLNT